MGQFSMEITRPTGSLPGGNQNNAIAGGHRLEIALCRSNCSPR
jgi:hypothetical protein